MAELSKPKKHDIFKIFGSISLLHKYRLGNKELTVYLSDGKTFTGKLRWFDEYAVKIVIPGARITIPIHNIIHYQCENFSLDGELVDNNNRVFRGQVRSTEREEEQLYKYKRDKELLHFYMKDGSEVIGRLQWYEDYLYAVRPDNSNKDCMITKRQIMYYRKIKVN
jgi:small nuclear ribonucleoprotein (snRNP)-like protein